MYKHLLVLFTVFLQGWTSQASNVPAGKASHVLPREVAGTDITGRPGDKIDLNLEFKDRFGETRKLQDFFIKDRPVFISMVYFNCPGLCNIHMNGVFEALDSPFFTLTPGEEYTWLSISIDPKETPDLAAQKITSYQKIAKRPEAIEKAWHFLTGQPSSIKSITQQLGFNYKWDEITKQYVHAAAVYSLTPDGVVSQVHSNVSFSPRTLKLSAIEASKGAVGNYKDLFLYYCYELNPNTGQYTLVATTLMKFGGLITLILLALFLGPVWLKEFKK